MLRRIPLRLVLAAMAGALMLGATHAGPLLSDDDDRVFGEWLLPCQYRSPPSPGCERVRHCRKVGKRWLCSRWKNVRTPRAVKRKNAFRQGRYVRRGRR